MSHTGSKPPSIALSPLPLTVLSILMEDLNTYDEGTLRLSKPSLIFKVSVKGEANLSQGTLVLNLDA